MFPTNILINWACREWWSNNWPQSMKISRSLSRGRLVEENIGVKLRQFVGWPDPQLIMSAYYACWVSALIAFSLNPCRGEVKSDKPMVIFISGYIPGCKLLRWLIGMKQHRIIHYALWKYHWWICSWYCIFSKNSPVLWRLDGKFKADFNDATSINFVYLWRHSVRYLFHWYRTDNYPRLF